MCIERFGKMLFIKSVAIRGMARDPIKFYPSILKPSSTSFLRQEIYLRRHRYRCGCRAQDLSEKPPLVPEEGTVANFDVGVGTVAPSPAETTPPSNVTLEAQPRAEPKETPEIPLHCDLPSANNDSLVDQGATRQPVEDQKPLSHSLGESALDS